MKPTHCNTDCFKSKMYLTRIAGIETFSFAISSGVIVMYLTRIAGIETSGVSLPAVLCSTMYLTRIAGIETFGLGVTL